MQLALVIDLFKSKGRPHGSANKDHKYLLRYIDPKTGEWVRIYPDEDDGKFNEKGQFELHPGITIADIVNRKLFGGMQMDGDQPALGADSKPILEDGKFVRYHAVTENEYRLEVALSIKQKRPNKLSRDAISVEQVGKWFVFAYPTVPATEWDAKGKPTRWGGFLSSEDFSSKVNSILHTSLVSKYGYKVPAKIEKFHIATADQMAIVAHHHLKIPSGPGSPKQTLATEEFGHEGPHKVGPGKMELPALTHETTPPEVTEVLGPFKSADPLDIAKQLQDRLALGKKKAGPAATGVTHVGAIPDWVYDKFTPEELSHELTERPVTTLLSLGVYKTPLDPALTKRLTNEWTGKIRGMAGLGWEALKHTESVEQAAAADAAAGKGPSSPSSLVRQIRIEKTNDYAQEAHKMLLEIAQTWKPRYPAARFDQYVGLSIKRMVQRESYKEAIAKNTSVPILHEAEAEAAIRQSSSVPRPLTPAESSDLLRVTPVARVALHEAMLQLPETYRRVLSGRLFLADGELHDTADPSEQEKVAAAEAEKKEEHLTKIEQEMYEDKIAGKLVAMRPRGTEGWQRNWTGPTGIADMYGDWMDPDTGKHVDFGDMTQKKQIDTLQKWFEGALTHVRDQLSHKGKLTPRGVAVKRYLELESKLAAASRDWQTENHKTAQLPAPGGKVEGVKYEPLSVVDFFSSSKVQDLAQKIGLATETQSFKDRMGGTTHAMPNINLGSHRDHMLALAKDYHARLKKYAAMSGADQASVAVDAQQRIERTLPHKWDLLLKTAEKYVEAKKSGDAKFVESAKSSYSVASKFLGKYDDVAMGHINMAVEAELMTPDLKQAVMERVARSHRAAKNDLELLRFAQSHAEVLKSLKPTKYDTADTLIKALLDYDFELGRLVA